MNIKGLRIERRIRFVLAAILVAMLPGLTACIPGASQSPIPEISPTMTQNNMYSEGGTIVLFRNVVAGDYNLLLLNADGHIESVGWNRLNSITMYKRGDIGAEEASAFFRSFEEIGFSGLESQYDVYPLPEGSEVVYEDIYYAIRVAVQAQEKVVIAHDAATPSSLKGVIDTMYQALSRIPDEPVTGNYVIAGDYEFLRFKRFVIGQQDLALQLEEQDVQQHPSLREVFMSPYLLSPIERLEGTQLKQVLSSEQNAVGVHFGDQLFDVLLLGGTGTQ